MNPLIYINLSTINYLEALQLQQNVLTTVQNGGNDTLILLEHPKVITMGLNAHESNILFTEEVLIEKGYDIQKIKRGGDVTYHGPGQLVGYTIVNLKKNHGGSIKNFVSHLEQLFIDYLQDVHNISASRDPINAGVFVGNDKITAIGLSVHKGVTMHGFAFNINTQLDDFSAIVPCGLKDRGVTSLQRLTGHSHAIDTVKRDIVKRFAALNNYSIV
jgi:lipoyl(octanoyl) transferase